MIIETERLTIVPHDLHPLSAVREAIWLNNKKVTKYSEQRHKKHSTFTQVRYYSQLKQNDLFFKIIRNKTHIGNLLATVDTRNDIANVGILIGDTRYWKKGLGEEAWRAFIEHVLARGIRRVEAGCMGENQAMVKLATAACMNLDGQIPGHFLLRNKPVDLLLFGRNK